MDRELPIRYRNSVNGGNFQKMFEEHKYKFIIGGVVIVAFLVGIYLYRRSRDTQIKKDNITPPIPSEVKKTTAAQASQTQTNAPKRKRVLAADNSAPTQAPVAPAQITIPPNSPQNGSYLCGGNLPKPFNVFQDDLVGANDITVGPGVMTESGASFPENYAGSCSGVNPSAVWQSTQLLPSNCGQSLEGTSDWQIYAPSNYQVTNFLSAGANFGQDTVMTTLKNASLDLRPEPPIPMSGCFQVPFGQSSWADNALMNTDWSHSLIA